MVSDSQTICDVYASVSKIVQRFARWASVSGKFAACGKAVVQTGNAGKQGVEEEEDLVFRVEAHDDEVW
jgi:hypothetical protein